MEKELETKLISEVNIGQKFIVATNGITIYTKLNDFVFATSFRKKEHIWHPIRYTSLYNIDMHKYTKVCTLDKHTYKTFLFLDLPA